MPVYNIAAQTNFCGNGTDKGQSPISGDCDLLVGRWEGEDFNSRLCFDLAAVKSKYDQARLKGAFLLLKVSLNNIVEHTGAYHIRSGDCRKDGFYAKGYATSFIIPFHWTELIIIELTALVKEWFQEGQPYLGLIIEGTGGDNNLVGFADMEGEPQLLLWLEDA